jgi:uncharacterized OB-fold protein
MAGGAQQSDLSAQQSARPVPGQVMPDDLDKPFWEAVARREFLLHRCRLCRRYYWPASCCVKHGGRAMEWVPASGRGLVYTYTIFHRQYHPAFVPPYNVAVVKLDEGPFFHTNVIEIAPEALWVGMPVEVSFEELAPGSLLPQFRPWAPEVA